MELSEYTTEELKAEISRRYALKKAECDKVKRCRMCKYLGSVTYWGQPLDNPTSIDTCCPFQHRKWKTRILTTYKCMNPSTKACEHFEEKELNK